MDEFLLPQASASQPCVDFLLHLYTAVAHNCRMQLLVEIRAETVIATYGACCMHCCS